MRKPASGTISEGDVIGRIEIRSWERYLGAGVGAVSVFEAGARRSAVRVGADEAEYVAPDGVWSVGRPPQVGGDVGATAIGRGGR